MNSQSQEVRILLVIQVIRTNQEMLIRHVIKTYDVSRTTLRNRIEDCTSKIEERNVQYNLTPTEKETFIRHILDLNLREFSFRINNVRDMTDLLRKMYYVKSINK